MPGGETASFEMAPVIAEAIRQTRAEALEEAAKIALKIENEASSGDVISGYTIAEAIRERAKA